MGYNNDEGSKYQATKDLGHAELKKAILAEVNAYLSPMGCRATLLNPHYSSFRITVKGLQNILEPAFVKAEALGKMDEYQAEFRRNFSGRRMVDNRYTAHAATVLGAVRDIAEAYNFDESDIMTDYFHVRFYLGVEPDEIEERANKESILAAHSPLRAERDRLLDGFRQVANDKLLMTGGLPQTKGRRFNLKPAKPLLKLTKKEHMGWGFGRLIGRILGAEAEASLVAGLARIDTAIAASPNGDWNDEAMAKEAA